MRRRTIDIEGDQKPGGPAATPDGRPERGKAGLPRLARPVALMAFSPRSGARVHAMAFALIVPDASGDRASNHQNEQQETCSSIQHSAALLSAPAGGVLQHDPDEENQNCNDP
jgi:hypothetical protein